MKLVWMMAMIAVVFASVPVSVSAAGPTLVQLVAPPPPPGLANVHWGYCAASGFNADGSIAGVCQFSYGSAQRFHSSPTNSYWMTWASFGQIVGLGAQCGHSTGYPTGNWAQPGCARNYQGTGTVVTINGVPYYYAATYPATGNQIVSSNASSFLVLQSLPPVPKAPAVSVVLSSIYAQVSWSADPSTAPAITSSVITLTPAAGSSAPTLTSTVKGNTTTTISMGPLQSQTTYLVTVVNIDAGGSSPAGSASISTPVSTVAPAAPTISSLYWAGGTQLAVSWTAPATGDSPIDSYQVQVVFVDGDAASGPYTQSVSAQTLSAYFPVDPYSTWTVQVHAHNAAGWGAWSAPGTLPGL